MATLQELAAGIKQINDQREEIAQLKREIKELRLQLVSIAQYQTDAKPQTTWAAPNRLETRVSNARKPQLPEDAVSDAQEISELIDEVVPNEPVVLPRTVNRQQLADIIAELRANEPPQKDPIPKEQPKPKEQPEPKEQPPSKDSSVLEDPFAEEAPQVQTFGVDELSKEEASILLEKSYIPPTSQDDVSNLSRVSSRGHARDKTNERRWWQFWKS
jgi:hypothetical protein